MDFNGDGKHDWKDDMILLNIISANKDESEKNSHDGGNRCLGEDMSFYISPLSKAVIVLVVILCISALFMGYADAICNMLEWGIVAFMISQRISR